MSENIKEKLWHAFDEGWNKGHTDAMYALCAQGFVHHRPPFPDLVGVQAEKLDIENSFKTFSNIRFIIHELAIVDDTAVIRWTWQAKHTGQSDDLPIPPSGKDVSMKGCSILHLNDSKIIDEWEFGDYLGFYTQLGITWL